MGRFKYLYMLILILIPIRSYPSSTGAKYLTKGSSGTIETEYRIGDVAISDPSVCDYMVHEGRMEVYLNPLRTGQTTLTLWDTEGNKRDVIPITVGLSSADEVFEELKEIFRENNLVKLSRVEDEIIVEGEASSPEEIAKVTELSKRFPLIIPKLKLTSRSIDRYCRKIESAIGIPGVRVRYIKGRVILEGVAYSKDAYTKAESIAKLFEPSVLNLLEMRETGRHPGRDELIQLDIYFVEVKKGALRTFGIQWAPGAVPMKEENGGGFLSGVVGAGRSLVGFVFNLVPKIRLLKERGDARVLENPSFIVKSGETVDFFSGTQVPYMSGDNITFKEVGVKVEAEPIVAGRDVDIRITTVVSSPSAGVDKGIDTNKLTTSAYLKSGQSVVLGGILRNNDAKQYNRIPSGLDTSSALFTLSLSKDYQSNQSEFLIFITPTIVEQSENAEENLREWFKMDEDITKGRSKKEKRHLLKKRRGMTGWSGDNGLKMAEPSGLDVRVPPALAERVTNAKKRRSK